MTMKLGERGQVTIPKDIRMQFSITSETEIQFLIVDGMIVLQPKREPLNLDKWKGKAATAFQDLGYETPDQMLADLRGRDDE